MSGKLLDTTVLVDLSRGNTDAADFVGDAAASGTPLFVSVVSAMELIAGCRDKTEAQRAQKLIASFTLIHLSSVESAAAYDLVVAYNKATGCPYQMRSLQPPRSHRGRARHGQRPPLPNDRRAERDASLLTRIGQLDRPARLKGSLASVPAWKR
jgi:hypothetical protein